MKHLLDPLRSQSGVIIIGAFIVTFFFLMTSIAIAEFGANHYVNTKRTHSAASALNAAEAGADAFMHGINENATYKGTNNAPSSSTDSCVATMSPVTLTSNTAQGKTTYESCIQDGTLTNEKLVTVTGKVYLPVNASTPKVTRKVRLVIQSTGSGAGHIVQTGNGGLKMTNSSSLGSGSVYLNGRLEMSNSATIGAIGQQSFVYVAGMGCGSGASFPQLCAGTSTSTLPIYMTNTSHIYADVHSPNMTGSLASSTRSRMTNAGLVDANAPTLPMPDDNRSTVMGRNSWTTVSGASGSCSSGTKTWAAGTKFTGDVSVSNTCKVTVEGDIWITGSLQLSNSSSAKVGATVTQAPNILIDGQHGFRPTNSSSLQTNDGGYAFEIRTFWSPAGTCGTTCPVPTGSNLYTSTNTNTIITSNSVNLAHSTLHAVYSGILVGNATNVGRLIGQKVEFSNSGIVTFDGTGTGATGEVVNWDVKYYEQIFN